MTSVYFEDLFTMAGQLNGAAKALELGDTVIDRIRPQGATDEPGR